MKSTLQPYIEAIKAEVESKHHSYHTVAIRTIPIVEEAINTIYRMRTDKAKALQYLADSIRPQMVECWQSGKSFGSGNLFLATCEWLEYNECNGTDETFQDFPYYGYSDLGKDFVEILLKQEFAEKQDLIVYRGGELDGWSWTTNKAVACAFASYNKTPLYRMEISTDDIICMIGEDRNESEVIIDPSHIENLNPQPLQ